MAFKPAFAIWITGLPASGKSTIARRLRNQLASREIDIAVLESDQIRRTLTPNPTYDSDERERFYRTLIVMGALLVRHGVPVVFDATAHRRKWRDSGRNEIGRFMEVFVDCPLSICVARDPKGIYRRGQRRGGTVPGLHEPYEAQENPDVVIRYDEDPEEAAARIILKLIDVGFIPCQQG